MRLLFVDKDRTSARELHGEFLDYRGVNWSLTHCQDRATAIQKIEQDSYQCILYYAHGSLEEAEFETSELLQSANCPPVLTISQHLTAAEQLLMVARGCDDCVSRGEYNGSGVMRRLRMTETRNSVWNRQLQDIAHSSWTEAAWKLCQTDAPSSQTAAVKTAAVKTAAVTPAGREGAFQALSIHEGLPRWERNLQVAHLLGESSLAERDWLCDPQLNVQRVRTITELIERCEEDIHAFDTLLIEQSMFEDASPTELASIKGLLAVLPGVVLTLEKSDFASLAYLERGYSDCLVADRTTGNAFVSTLKKAVVRRRRALKESIGRQVTGPGVSDRRSSVRAGQFRRRHVRFLMQRPITVVPVLANGAPDIQGRTNAETLDVSLGGIGVRIPQRDQLPSRNWVIGLEQADGITGWVNAFLRRVDYKDDELHVGLIFQSDDDDLFNPLNLWPSIDAATRRFETRLPGPVLEQWGQLGILQQELVRRTRVCPECEAVCSVGTGCSQCGSFSLSFHDLIHHFACAHVEQTELFEKDGDVRCPKCLRSNLVPGADFELIRSQYTCQECHYRGDVTADVGCCLSCQLRFPIEMGKEVDIYGYHVQRLDVLAMVDAAR